MRHAFWAITALVLVDTCPGGPDGPIRVGTWGGDNAGAIVDDTALHVHIGCTFGNAPRPELVDGRFDVMGEYNVDAYPVDRGITHPARFTGQVRGPILTLTVTLTDTTRTLGPVNVVLGQEPRMGPCPICRVPGERRPM